MPRPCPPTGGSGGGGHPAGDLRRRFGTRADGKSAAEERVPSKMTLYYQCGGDRLDERRRAGRGNHLSRIRARTGGVAVNPETHP